MLWWLRDGSAHGTLVGRGAMPPQGNSTMIQTRKASLALALMACTFAAFAQAGTDGAARTLEPEVKQAVEGIAQGLMQVQDRDVELSCDKAVDNARYGLETMLEVGQKNADGGYIDRADFDRKATTLRASLAEITPQDCAAASGERQAFYRCMSSDYNHVVACAAAHRF